MTWIRPVFFLLCDRVRQWYQTQRSGRRINHNVPTNQRSVAPPFFPPTPWLRKARYETRLFRQSACMAVRPRPPPYPCQSAAALLAMQWYKRECHEPPARHFLTHLPPTDDTAEGARQAGIRRRPGRHATVLNDAGKENKDDEEPQWKDPRTKKTAIEDKLEDTKMMKPKENGHGVECWSFPRTQEDTQAIGRKTRKTRRRSDKDSQIKEKDKTWEYEDEEKEKKKKPQKNKGWKFT